MRSASSKLSFGWLSGRGRFAAATTRSSFLRSFARFASTARRASRFTGFISEHSSGCSQNTSSNVRVVTKKSRSGSSQRNGRQRRRGFFSDMPPHRAPHFPVVSRLRAKMVEPLPPLEPFMLLATSATC
ncbi:MAG: hypothetical protein H6721_12520 [Sandaracinus sp.]|nr:hypothetical protein [Sandaracinus sp.]